MFDNSIIQILKSNIHIQFFWSRIFVGISSDIDPSRANLLDLLTNLGGIHLPNNKGYRSLEPSIFIANLDRKPRFEFFASVSNRTINYILAQLDPILFRMYCPSGSLDLSNSRRVLEGSWGRIVHWIFFYFLVGEHQIGINNRTNVNIYTLYFYITIDKSIWSLYKSCTILITYVHLEYE